MLPDRHCYEVIPGWLYSRPGPEAYPWDLDELAAQGVRVIVSLTPGVAMSDIRAAGIQHQEFLFSDTFRRISTEKRNSILKRYLKFEGAVSSALRQRQPVLVHCRGGKDRTGFMLALYLARNQAMSIDRAIALVRKGKQDALSAGGCEEFAQRAWKLLKKQPSP